MERAFQQLVRERYIQRRRELSLPVDLLSGEPTQAGGFLVGDEGMSISMAAALEAKANASVEAMTSAASKKGRKAKAKPSSARGKKRGNTEENGGSGGGMEAKEEPSVGELWVLLPDQFLRDFRHESVLKYVKEKVRKQLPSRLMHVLLLIALSFAMPLPVSACLCLSLPVSACLCVSIVHFPLVLPFVGLLCFSSLRWAHPSFAAS